MSDTCDLCGKPLSSCRAHLDETGEGGGNIGDIIDCDGNVHELDVRDYLRLKRDMPGVIDTLMQLVHDRDKMDPVHAYIAINALALQLRKDHIDEPIERKLRKR